MNFRSILGAFVALLLAVGGTAYLAARSAAPLRPTETPTAPTPAETSATDPAPQLPVDKEPVHQTNPFDLAAPGPHSKAVVDVTHFEFGVMALGSKQSHDFVFKNEGTGPLRLAKGKLMCKCTMPAVPNDEIKPGESIGITLTWKPEEATRDFAKEAVIWTNDPAHPKITLSIKGEVFEDPSVSPHQFSVGEIPWDQEQESEIKLVSLTTAEMSITAAEVSHPEWMSVTWAPIDSAQLQPTESTSPDGKPNPKPVSGFTLKLKILPLRKVGPFTGWVTLKLAHPELERKINVSGSRFGPIKIHGPDYQAALSLVNMKRFKSDQGKEAKLFLFMKPFEQDFQILEIVSPTKHLTATLRKDSKPGEKWDRYVLMIQAVPGITPGATFSVENPDTLTLKTNHPQVPEMVFKASYIVQ